MFNVPVLQSVQNPPGRRRRVAGAGHKLGVEPLERRELLDTGLAAGLTSSNANLLVKSLYTSLLNRAAQPSELTAWQSDVNAGQRLQDVAQAFLSSPEYQTDFITDSYATLLKRQPQAQEVNSWLQATQAGLSQESLTAQFLASEEYYQEHGGTPEGWLTGLYWDLFQRTPDAAGFFLWRDGLQSGTTRETIALDFVTSPEASARVVTASYEQMLGRAPDAAGEAAWVAALTSGLSRTQLIAGLIDSPEYVLTHSSTSSDLPSNPTAHGAPADFAFGPAWWSVPQGTTGVSLATYNTQTGYGWDSNTGLVVQDGGGIAGLDSTFRVDLPNGIYTVTPTLGNTTVAHNSMAVWAQGVKEVSGVNTAPGQLLRPSFTVQVTDGQLTLRFTAQGVGNSFALNQLAIVPTLASGTSTGISTASPGTTDTTPSPDPSNGDVSGSPSSSSIQTIAQITVNPASLLPIMATIHGAPDSSPVNVPISLTSIVSDQNPGATAAGFDYTWRAIVNDVTVAQATTPSFTFTPLTAGFYSVRLTVTDAYNMSFNARKTINVGNVSLNLNPSVLPSGAVNSAYTATLTTTDVSGTYSFAVTSGSLPSGLSLNASTGVLSGTPTTGGTSSFTITATDSTNAGITGSQSYTLTVNPTTSPSPLVVNAGANSSTQEGAVIQFAGTVTGGTAPYTYSWDFGDGDKASGSLTPSYTYANSGSYTVRLTVTDANNQLGQSSLQVTVQDVPPSVRINGAPSSSAVGTPLSLISTVTSPSPADMAAGFRYAWSITENGTPLHAGTTPDFSFTPSSAGTYVASLTVTASDGATGTASQTITVGNATSSGPLSVAMNGAPASSPEGAPISLTSTVTSSSSADMSAGFSYRWSVTKDGAAFASATTPNFNFTPTDHGSYVVTLVATAQDKTTGTASQTITVTDVAPLVTISGAPASSTPGTAISLTSSVFSPSPADMAAGFRYAWSVTSNGAVVASGSTANFSFTPATAGTYVVGLTVTDNDGATGTTSKSIAVADVSGGWIHVQDDPGNGLTSPNAVQYTYTVGAFRNPVMLGDLVIVSIAGAVDPTRPFGASDVTCTDNAATPNPYQQLGFYREINGDRNGFVAFFAARIRSNPASGNLNPTVNINSANNVVPIASVGASEFSGGSPNVDGTPIAAEVDYITGPVTLNFSVTTTTPNDLLIGMMNDNRVEPTSWTPPGGFTPCGTTKPDPGGDWQAAQSAYRILSGTLTNQALTWSNNGTATGGSYTGDGTICGLIVALEG